MAVRPYLRSGGAIITRRKNELWYRRRLKLIADDAKESITPALRRYLDTLSRSQNELIASDRALVTREITMLLDHARTHFRMPIDAQRTAEYAAQINLRSTDEWWTQQLRTVVEVSASSLPQPRIEDAAPTRRRGSATSISRPTTRRRPPAAVRAGTVQPLATLNLIRGQAQIQSAFSSAVQTNVALIRSIPTQYHDRMEELLFENIAKAQRWEQLIDGARSLIADVDNLVDYRAELIARDQSAKMAALFNRVRSESVGIDSYIWQTAGDERVRDSHRENDGKAFRFDEPPEETGNPGDDVNCRCAALPIVEEAYLTEEEAA